MISYLEQSVEVLMGNGTLTPHLLGRPITAPELKLTLLARFLRQLHAVWRSALVEAFEFRLFTPLQQFAGGAPWPLRAYAMQGATADATSPHVIAVAVCCAVRRRMATAAAVMTRILELAIIYAGVNEGLRDWSLKCDD
jgi:hypothetical protein